MSVPEVTHTEHKIENMTDEQLEKILASPSGRVCALCGHKITNAEEIAYGDMPHCCDKHGFINLCPTHQDWWHKNEANGTITENTCIKELYRK